MKYTHLFLEDEIGFRGIKGKIVPISEAENVARKTLFNFNRVMLCTSEAEFEIVRPEYGRPYRRAVRGCSYAHIRKDSLSGEFYLCAGAGGLNSLDVKKLDFSRG